MHLTPEDIAEFEELVKKETGVELTDQEASERASKLVNLVCMIVAPLPEESKREARAVPLWGG